MTSEARFRKLEWVQKVVETFDPVNDKWFEHDVMPVITSRKEKSGLVPRYIIRTVNSIRREVYERFGSECATAEFKSYLEYHDREEVQAVLGDKDKKFLRLLHVLKNSPKKLQYFKKDITKKLQKAKNKSQIEEKFTKLKLVRPSFLF
jgi:hypothetical protein